MKKKVNLEQILKSIRKRNEKRFKKINLEWGKNDNHSQPT
jgi:hypothetical protein